MWYNTEYLIGNMTVNGVYSARRYLNRMTGPRYLTVDEFAHLDVSRQPAWDRARAQSIWRRRIERLWASAEQRRLAYSGRSPSSSCGSAPCGRPSASARRPAHRHGWGGPWPRRLWGLR